MPDSKIAGMILTATKEKAMELLRIRLNLNTNLFGSINAFNADSDTYQKWCEFMIFIIAEKQKEKGEINDNLRSAWSIISLSLPLK